MMIAARRCSRGRIGGALLVLAAVAATLTAAAPAPAAKTTLDRTVRFEGEVGTYRELVEGRGQSHQVRDGQLANRKGARAGRRTSLAYFAQLTDPQIADEMSPLRVEKTDPIGGLFTAAWRPQESLGTHVLDQIARSINDNERSPTRAAGGRAELGFSILTGDQPDNQQYNEVGWYLDVLRGDSVSPFSGQPISGSNRCDAASAAERAQLDAKVAAQEYTGVQDYDEYPGRPATRYNGFWDPERATDRGPYSFYPRYENLLDVAQEPFQAEGLQMPWYTSRGNHDGLIQGNIPANSSFLTGLVTGCLKYFPSAEFDPATIPPDAGTAVFTDPELLAKLLTGGELVPPDPDRRFVSKIEYKELHRGEDRSHGFGYVGGKQLTASDGNASYYSFAPAKGTRFIALDTVAEGGGANGNLDDPQYRWLERQLDRWTSVSYSKGRLRQDGGKNKLIVIYGHHTLATMDNPTPDEDAGACSSPPLPGCDGDPRDSEPIHLGTSGPQSVRSLLRRFPNVILAVTGHTHHNAVSVHKGKRKRGFWEINTASHIDFPQQSRLIELIDNGDETLSIFGTVVDQAGPIVAPEPGDTSGFSNRQLASLSRRLAANDPQSKSVTDGGGTGTRSDRNVELLIKDPRRLAR
jgi:metallophosphoesterase (TIGR03767 family)